MNYGDGVYGGMVLTAMYTAAFYEKDPEKIVRAGLAVVPPESDTRQILQRPAAPLQTKPHRLEKDLGRVQQALVRARRTLPRWPWKTL